MSGNLETGKAGEALAVKFLKKKGYKILERNCRSLCEIDVICEKDGVTVFVEVKTRSGTRFGLGREAVDAYRQLRYRRGAAVYLRSRKLLESPVRFDVVEIQDGAITHIENAF